MSMTPNKNARLEILRLNLPDDVLLLYGQAVQTLAGADGELSAGERAILFDDAQVRGIPNNVITAWQEFDWRRHDSITAIMKIRPLISQNDARLLIFDAVRIARGDGGYPLEEQSAIAEAAEALFVSPDILTSIEALVSMEHAVDELRLALFGTNSID